MGERPKADKSHLVKYKAPPNPDKVASQSGPALVLSGYKMGFVRSFGIASCAILGAQAAVSSTGFTVSLTDVDYFLPPKPIASIAGCEGLQSLFEDGTFAPFTVLSGSSSVSSFAEKDDVWQEGFLEGTSL